MFTQAQLNQARNEALREARGRPAKTEMAGGDGVVSMRIPLKAYLNAVGGHGVSPKDTEYWNDMARLYPETQVKYSSRKLTVRMGRRNERGERTAGPGHRTRFGRVTFHKSYPEK